MNPSPEEDVRITYRPVWSGGRLLGLSDAPWRNVVIIATTVATPSHGQESRAAQRAEARNIRTRALYGPGWGGVILDMAQWSESYPESESPKQAAVVGDDRIHYQVPTVITHTYCGRVVKYLTRRYNEPNRGTCWPCLVEWIQAVADEDDV